MFVVNISVIWNHKNKLSDQCESAFVSVAVFHINQTNQPIQRVFFFGFACEYATISTFVIDVTKRIRHKQQTVKRYWSRDLFKH